MHNHSAVVAKHSVASLWGRHFLQRYFPRLRV